MIEKRKDKGKEIYYHIFQSFLVAHRSLEYIWIAVVLIELILVIQSQQTLSEDILCTAHFALSPEKPETKTWSLGVSQPIERSLYVVIKNT